MNTVEKMIEMKGWNQIPTVKWNDLGKDNQDWVLEQWQECLDKLDPDDIDIWAVGIVDYANDRFYEDHPDWNNEVDGYCDESDDWDKYKIEAAKCYIDSLREAPYSMGVEDWWNEGCFNFRKDYYSCYSLFESYGVDEYGNTDWRHHQEGYLSDDDFFGPKEYFVVEGKVTDDNAYDILTAWSNSGEANHVHFVDYAKAGSKSAYDKVFRHTADRPTRSWSIKASDPCTLECIKNKYNVIGSYKCESSVKNATPKKPDVEVVNQSVIDKVRSLADGTYGDVVIYLINGKKCIRGKNSTRFRYYIADIADDYKWNGTKYVNSKNRYLKTTYAKLLLKAYNQ